jgi:hypothetical protein
LHSVWTTIEAHAERIDRLCRQQAGISFEVLQGQEGSALSVRIPLAQPGKAIQVLLQGEAAQYFVLREGEPVYADLDETRVDRAVYLLLAELAAEGV